jgi:UDP-N-acetylmuramate--alanine ligase
VETVGESKDVVVLSDRATSPEEVETTLAAVRESHPDRRLIIVFQPSPESLTAENQDRLTAILGVGDAILITDVYSEGQPLSEGPRVPDMVRKIAETAPTKSLLYLPDKKDVVGALVWVTHPGDVVLILGKGDIHEVAERFLNAGPARR